MNSNNHIFERNISYFLANELPVGKVCLLVGPRRTGKTFLLENLVKSKNNVLFLNGEDIETHLYLENQSKTNYNLLFEKYELIIIDEAQKIKAIGEHLKFLVDIFPNKRFIASGSSSFDLQSKSGEPLLGRKITRYLFPITFSELINNVGIINSKSLLDQLIIFGSYPEQLNIITKIDKIEYLNEIVNSLLLKYILIYENIKNSDIIYKVVRLLAEQLGQIVSVNEISSQVGVSRSTVNKYINLLKNFFVIFELKSFSKNSRKEITKSSKYYFWDNGLLNSLKKNFIEIDQREDKGHLWENFIISEMLKEKYYSRDYGEYFFWRNKNKSEIDLVYQKDSKLRLYEIKYSANKAKLSNNFKDFYGDHNLEIINKNNFITHLTNNKPANT